MVRVVVDGHCPVVVVDGHWPVVLPVAVASLPRRIVAVAGVVVVAALVGCWATAGVHAARSCVGELEACCCSLSLPVRGWDLVGDSSAMYELAITERAWKRLLPTGHGASHARRFTTTTTNPASTCPVLNTTTAIPTTTSLRHSGPQQQRRRHSDDGSTTPATTARRAQTTTRLTSTASNDTKASSNDDDTIDGGGGAAITRQAMVVTQMRWRISTGTRLKRVPVKLERIQVLTSASTRGSNGYSHRDVRIPQALAPKSSIFGLFSLGPASRGHTAISDSHSHGVVTHYRSPSITFTHSLALSLSRSLPLSPMVRRRPVLALQEAPA
ncbi:hypothetical protein EDB89DRAFT_2118953 [Lactarius sanguifluus]|nr:hypothetical protein EDB89DRAFT_2118953 [Lactarius sanguifluus]